MRTMYRNTFKEAFVSMLAVLALSVAGAGARAGWTEVKAGPNGHFLVQARINGVRTRAVIDTGASSVAIPWREAQRMGLHPALKEFNQTVATANGVVKVAPVKLRRVEIGPVVARDVRAVILPKGRLGVVLIGMSFLGKLRRYSVRANTLRLMD